MIPRMWLQAGIAVSLVALGFLGGWLVYHQKPAPQESYAPPIIQHDRSVVLERKPSPTTPSRPHVIPKGYKVERAVAVELKLDPLPGAPSTTPRFINLDLSLVSNTEGKRVVVSTDDGTIVGGVDVPVGTPSRPFKLPRHSLGAIYSPTRKDWGAYYDHDLGPIRLGATVMRLSHLSAKEWQVSVKAGIVW